MWGPIGYYFRLRFPLKPKIDRILGRLSQAGIPDLLRARHNWALARPGRDGERGAPAKPPETALALPHLYTVFMVEAAGLAVALACFLLEIRFFSLSRLFIKTLVKS